MQTASVRGETSVWGNDYPTEDGTNQRDYIYVVDLAKAHKKLWQKLKMSSER